MDFWSSNAPKSTQWVLGPGAEGFHTVDTDTGDWIAEAEDEERQWREDRIDVVIAEHERTREPLFLAGAVWNQQDCYLRFDHIVLHRGRRRDRTVAA
ncbi:hypothetical protein [Amycolatopsis sp. TNS106]|uniref:hypothetical protein n=1 Tax=Amycolatopsis sp. TNS106 TaxID=2861750 RepID=UPI002104E697|nr:hypothetical protein [Amycolatopsis sp. TNS106]